MMPYFSFFIAVPLYWMEQFRKFWDLPTPPEGVKTEDKTD